MNVPDKPVQITKVEAATRQVEAAIEAFRKGDFDIAITLAGAAEGIAATRCNFRGVEPLRKSKMSLRTYCLQNINYLFGKYSIFCKVCVQRTKLTL